MCQATVQDLQQAISKSGKGRLHPTRQRLTVPRAAGAKPTVLSSSKQLSDFNLADGSVVTLKDLGLQVWMVLLCCTHLRHECCTAGNVTQQTLQHVKMLMP